MSRNLSGWLSRHWVTLVWLGILTGVGITAWLTYERWSPQAREWMAFIRNEKQEPPEDASPEPAPTETPDTLVLSPVAWKNIGLVTDTVEPADFVKVVPVPAIVVERTGRSQVEIAAPMTGVVTRVYPLEREQTEPGSPLFDLRLTHEDVVSAQSEFLIRLQGLDVAERELRRLREIGTDVIARKRIIEQEYKRDEAQASLGALRQSLILHGLSEEQVTNIEQTRQVLQNVTVVAPPFATNHEHTEAAPRYHVQHIAVNTGQSVAAGDLLGVLADHCLLYVEGQAFEEDARRLLQAARQGQTVTVVPVSGDYGPEDALELNLLSVADQIDRQSRALKFYLLLPNELMNLTPDENSGGEFVAWKYRPGQRMEARIPTSAVMKNKIVLPPEAVVIEGPNAFVFEQNGDHFDRIDVHVLYRDKDHVILENDGQLAGSVLAMNGAYDMHLALKNQSGGAIDPHAGHNH